MPERGSKTSLVTVVWANLEFFGSIQVISCRDWWPWTKSGYIIMTRRQNKNQWSDGIAAHPAPPPKSWVQKSSGKVLASIFWGQDSILLIYYLPKGQSINEECYSFLLVQLEDILKENRPGKLIKVFLFLNDNASAHRALATQKKLAYLGFHFLDPHPILRIWSRRTTTCSLDWKNNSKVAIFLSTRRSLLPGNLVGRKNS